MTTIRARSYVALVICLICLVAGCKADPKTVEMLEDMQFAALIDSDGDGQSHDEPVTTLNLLDQLAAVRPNTRIVMVNAAAGWCEPCQREAAALPAFRAIYEPRGVAILTAVFQDPQGNPTTEAFARTWAETFALPIPVLIDSDFQVGAYFQANVMPANLFVDAETAEILLIATGAEPGDDPMRAYRELLDSYLAAP